MAKNNRYQIFSGTANPKLTQDIAFLLHKTLGKIEIATFADSEKRVRIEEEVPEKKVVVISSLSNPVDTHLVELCLIGDALKSNVVQSDILPDNHWCRRNQYRYRHPRVLR